MATLAWIKNYRPWKMFVRNQVNQIRKLTSVECWQHCLGDVNPADLPTRGISGVDFINDELWWEGPAFLKQEAPMRPASDISSNEIDCETDEVVKRELAKTNQGVTHSLLNKVNNDLNFINFNRFSSKSELIRTTTLPRLRELIKKYLRRCSICKRLEGKFFEPPPAPPLPDFRVSQKIRRFPMLDWILLDQC